jgi:hypothetical protein
LIVEHFVFVVYLDYLDAVEVTKAKKPEKSKRAHMLRDAKCVPLSDVHRMYDHRFKGGYASLERDLAPRPRVLRILIIDDGLPPPLDMFSCPFDLGEDLRAVADIGPNWLETLRELVDVGKGTISWTLPG